MDWYDLIRRFPELYKTAEKNVDEWKSTPKNGWWIL
jgi:hypothetical protein